MSRAGVKKWLNARERNSEKDGGGCDDDDDDDNNDDDDDDVSLSLNVAVSVTGVFMTLCSARSSSLTASSRLSSDK